MNIYFGGSITSGREHAGMYADLIDFLKGYGSVLTEHLGSSELTDKGENLTAKEIHDRDVTWLKKADVIIADVTIASLGVGYELGVAVSLGIPVVCLYRDSDKRLSGMIDGCDKMVVLRYTSLEDAKNKLQQYFNTCFSVTPRAL